MTPQRNTETPLNAVNFTSIATWAEWADLTPCSTCIGPGTKMRGRHCFQGSKQLNETSLCSGNGTETSACDVSACCKYRAFVLFCYQHLPSFKIAKVIKTKQNKTKQNKTKQNKTKQTNKQTNPQQTNKTKQNKKQNKQTNQTKTKRNKNKKPSPAFFSYSHFDHESEN